MFEKWVDESKPELAETVRFNRIDIRLRALRLLSQVASGLDVKNKFPGLAIELGKHPALGRHSSEILRHVEAAARGLQDCSQALAGIIKLLAVDSQPFVSGSEVRSTGWHLLPHWYKQTFERYLQRGEVGAARLVLLWYTRTITDYIWSVYEKNLAEEGKKNSLARPDFVFCNITSIHEVLEALAKALCWSGGPGTTLEKLIGLLKTAITADPVEISSSILPAIVQETASSLYPLPLKIVSQDRLDPMSAIAWRYDEEGQLHISRVINQIPDESFIYLKPRFKQSSAVVQQDSLTLYEATVFAVPKPVLVLCEGVTDHAALEVILDATDPTWRELDITILPCDGDHLPSIFRGHRFERPVVVADGDKRRDKGWLPVWRECCYSFILDPDLERLDFDALAQSLTQHWNVPVRTDVIRELSDRSTHGKQFERALCAKYGKPHFKSRTFGLFLGEQLVQCGVPDPIKELCYRVIQLANGLSLRCCVLPSVSSHRCLAKK